MTRDIYHVVEFYMTGDTRPFKRRSGLMNIPRNGDLIGFGDDALKVKSITWNLDYENERHEQWRANIYLECHNG